MARTNRPVLNLTDPVTPSENEMSEIREPTTEVATPTVPTIEIGTLPTISLQVYSADLSQLFVTGPKGEKACLANFKPENLMAAVQRTINHQTGNVAYAGVNNKIRKFVLGDTKDENAEQKKANEALVKKWGDDHEPEYNGLLAFEQMTEWEKMLNGAFKVSSRGPRRDPVEVEFDLLVLGEAKSRLARVRDANGNEFAWPDSDETILTLSNGTTRTRPQIMETVRADTVKMEELRARAESNVALRQGKAKAAAETTNDFATAGI